MIVSYLGIHWSLIVLFLNLIDELLPSVDCPLGSFLPVCKLFDVFRRKVLWVQFRDGFLWQSFIDFDVLSA